MKPPIAAAPDPIATLRRYLPLLPTSGARSTAAEAVDALDAELAALRETALDLSRVPEGWHFTQLTRIGDQLECCLTTSGGRFLIDADQERYGTGPTPRAALDAAIRLANEHGAKP